MTPSSNEPYRWAGAPAKANGLIVVAFFDRGRAYNGGEYRPGSLPDEGRTSVANNILNNFLRKEMGFPDGDYGRADRVFRLQEAFAKQVLDPLPVTGWTLTEDEVRSQVASLENQLNEFGAEIRGLSAQFGALQAQALELQQKIHGKGFLFRNADPAQNPNPLTRELWE